MKIITYSTSEEGVHPAYACVALVIYDNGQLAPVVFTARSEAIVREAAQIWWDEEAARVAKKYEGASTPAPRRPRKRREEPADYDEHAGAPDGDILGYLQTAPQIEADEVI